MSGREIFGYPAYLELLGDLAELATFLSREGLSFRVDSEALETGYEAIVVTVCSAVSAEDVRALLAFVDDRPHAHLSFLVRGGEICRVRMLSAGREPDRDL